MNNSDALADNGRFVGRLFLKNASVNAAAQLISVTGPMISGIMTGRYFGIEGLTMTALFSPLFLLACFLGCVISGGGSTAALEHLARDDIHSIRRLYTVSVFLSATAGFSVCTVMLFFKNSILPLIYNGTPNETVEMYYIFTSFYLLFTTLSHVPLYWSRFVGRIYVGPVMTVSLTLFNVAFNLINIEILEFNAEGIALGQATAAALSFAAAMLLLVHNNKIISFTRPENISVAVRRIFLTGSFMGLSKFCRFLLGIIANAFLINKYGRTAVAVCGLLNTFHRFISACSAGITATVIPLSGVFYEERDTVSIRQLVKSSIIFSA